jgi:short subunit dehydrogenase-like uncharacterized protein
VSGRIVVFGATGYTGEQTARALVARGVRPVLAARSRERLEALADELGGLEVAVADVARPETVRALVSKGDVLLSTVGPFSLYGAAALDAAIDAGAMYIDSTGEPAFIRSVFERHGPAARRAGVPLLTAFGFDWVPGNLAGGLALREAGGRASRVEIGYFTSGGISGGTRASTVQAMLEPSFAFRRGRLRSEPAGARVKRFTLAAGKRCTAISVGGTEHFGLPATYPELRNVDVLIGQHGPHVPVMPVISRAMAGALAVPGVRRRLMALAQERVQGSSGGPDEQARERSGSNVVAIAYDARGEQVSQVTLTGVNPYTFTFGVLAWAATHPLSTDAGGALSPIEAFGLDALQDGARQAGLART